MSEVVKKEAKNLTELRSLAEGFLGVLAKAPTKEGATVVGLSGELGAGKTAFTKCVADVLGITEVITSPTFILEKIYTIPRGSIVGDRFTKLVHIDAYRLESGSEMLTLGWASLLEDKNILILLEWPEHVLTALPEDMIKLSFEHVREGVRSIIQ